VEAVGIYFADKLYLYWDKGNLDVGFVLRREKKGKFSNAESCSHKKRFVN